MLAGISVEHYTQLELGTVRGASDDALEAIARALQFDAVERVHLFDLVHAAKQRPTRSRRPRSEIRPGVQRMLDAITDGAAFVRKRPTRHPLREPARLRPLADAFTDPGRPVNLARFVFLDPRSRVFYRDWPDIADASAGSLRAEAGRDPYDRQLTELVGELSMRSPEFSTR